MGRGDNLDSSREETLRVGREVLDLIHKLRAAETFEESLMAWPEVNRKEAEKAPAIWQRVRETDDDLAAIKALEFSVQAYPFLYGMGFDEAKTVLQEESEKSESPE